MEYLWEGSSGTVGSHGVQLLSLDGTRIIEAIDGEDEDGLIMEEADDAVEYLDENLIYMASEDGSIIPGQIIQVQNDKNADSDNDEQQIQGHQSEEYMECEVVTEEVITDDFLQAQGARDEIMVEAIASSSGIQVDDEINVPLPVEEDEYTVSRPFPCDFCSRRFKKSANLINHMVAHSNERPHVCNLCGHKYIRRCDLLNHLKDHAYRPEDDPINEEDYAMSAPSPKKTGGKRAPPLTYQENERLIPILSKKSNKKLVASKGKTASYTSSLYRQNSAKKPQVTAKKKKIMPEFVPNRYPVLDDRKPFVCQHCGVAFAREKALASHSRIHGGDSPFECESCGDLFWDHQMLQDHIKSKHGTSNDDSNSEFEHEPPDDESINEYFETNFNCDMCGTPFKNHEMLKKHIRDRHTVDNALADIFENSDDDDDEDYTPKESDKDRPLTCNVCNDTFAEALDLLAHAEVHARNEPHVCQLCGTPFLEELAIKNHVQLVHSKELTDLSCRICGKGCKNHSTLMKHAWEHSRDRSHSCSKCGKTFHNKARLKRHMVSHRNKTVRCEICNEIFPDGRTLSNHRHSHTKSSQFPCLECGKSFGSRSSQQIHIRIHTGERPYGCRFCWKAFADGGSLRKHERIHTGEKPYACSVCSRAFNQRVVLREHIRSHHSAPDLKRGSDTKPYFCEVCKDMFQTSQELILHLIAHSDAATAEKRQPTTGPRKYKRRRRLKPHEVERLELRRGKFDSEFDFSEHSNDGNINHNTESFLQVNEHLMKYMEPVAGGSKDPNPFEFSLPKLMPIEDSKDKISVEMINRMAFESPKRRGKQFNIGSTAATNGGSQRTGPRMIHTQKTRVATVDGSKRKTKTMITKEIKSDPFSNSLKSRSSKNIDIVPSEKISTNFPLLDDGSDHQDDAMPFSMTPKRMRIKQETNFEDLVDHNLLMEISKKDKYIDKYNSDIVNDLEEILRSPIKNVNKAPPATIMASPVHEMENNYTEESPKRKRPNKSKEKATEVEEMSKEERRKLMAISRSERLNRRNNQFQTLVFEPEPKIEPQVNVQNEESDDDDDDDDDDEDEEDDEYEWIEIKGAAKSDIPHKCEICKIGFNSKAELSSHVGIHF